MEQFVINIDTVATPIELFNSLKKDGYQVADVTELQELNVNPTDVLTAFVGWLTTKQGATTLSRRTSPEQALDLVQQFASINQFPPASETWFEKIKTPLEQEATAAARKQLSEAFAKETKDHQEAVAAADSSTTSSSQPSGSYELVTESAENIPAIPGESGGTPAE